MDINKYILNLSDEELEGDDVEKEPEIDEDDEDEEDM